ncbi:putative quinol monooxygenase [Mycolicibacterium sp. ELW1]|uniref:putative quinol monooxygenase n=1 Tax=Mycobacteriaceae TaxID=1762 RepID=UPI0011EFC345|nr:antibiotic biosynthesis monooxygenase [Mycobacterium sp. ELW1]QEN13030.1 antibiotic biosynthesis monooxygenase [Mycobacterium sp. ELW1]
MTPQVVLSGQLVCATDDEAATVHRHLPRHVELTRAESGCVSFEVHRTDDHYVWQVDERFVNDAAFDAHQARVAASEWGRVTAGIERRYSIRRTMDES